LELTGKFIIDELALSIRGSLYLKIRDQSVGNLFIYSRKECEITNLQSLQDVEELARQLRRFEQDLQREIVKNNLSLAYNDHLKHLRRQLPISKTKIDWARASAPLAVNKKQ
jgi:hypothetical protein